MTTKQKFGFEAIKKGFYRTKQKFAEKFTGAQKTVDIQYDQEWQRFKEHDELVNKLKKAEIKYIKVLRELCVLENKLATDITNIFEHTDELYKAAQENKKIMAELDNARVAMEEQIQQDFLDALTVYLRQFGILKERDKERARRLIDMDRYKHDYKRHTEKGDSGKASANKRKYHGMKKAYEALNNEMLQDIPALIKDKDEFFSPLLATHVNATAHFYMKAAELLSQMVQWVMHVNKDDIHTYASVITDEEQSCWNKQIDLAKAIDTYKPIARGSQVTNNTPPSSNSIKNTPPSSNSHNNRSLPPKPAANKPQARALYPFQGVDNTELSFNAGDIINLVDAQDGADWWTGELRGVQGLIPANYVQRI